MIERLLPGFVKPALGRHKNTVTPDGAFRFGKSRNMKCPCGSGKKIKHCHAQGVGTSRKYVTLKRTGGEA